MRRVLLILMAFALLDGCGQDSPSVEGKERVGASEANPPEETAAPRSTDDGNSAEKEARPEQERSQKREERSTEEASGPSPGYNLIETPDGGFSMEVPPSGE